MDKVQEIEEITKDKSAPYLLSQKYLKNLSVDNFQITFQLKFQLGFKKSYYSPQHCLHLMIDKWKRQLIIMRYLEHFWLIYRKNLMCLSWLTFCETKCLQFVSVCFKNDTILPLKSKTKNQDWVILKYLGRYTSRFS